MASSALKCQSRPVVRVYRRLSLLVCLDVALRRGDVHASQFEGVAFVHRHRRRRESPGQCRSQRVGLAQAEVDAVADLRMAGGEV